MKEIAIYVEGGWAAFNWYDILFAHWVYVVILVAMLATPVLGVIAARRERVYVRRNVLPLAVLALVGSSLPPSPASTTACRTSCSTNARQAIAHKTSRNAARPLL